jgi:hypothetical protein
VKGEQRVQLALKMSNVKWRPTNFKRYCKTDSYHDFIVHLTHSHHRKYLCYQVARGPAMLRNIKLALDDDVHILKTRNGGAMCRSLSLKGGSYNLLARILAQDIVVSIEGHNAILIDTIVLCDLPELDMILNAIERHISVMLTASVFHDALWQFTIHRPEKMFGIFIEHSEKIIQSDWLCDLGKEMIRHHMMTELAGQFGE